MDVAINRAADECIKDGILKDILESQKKEAFDMVLTEFDEEKYEAIVRESGKVEIICRLVSKKLISVEVALEELNCSKQQLIWAMENFEYEILEELK